MKGTPSWLMPAIASIVALSVPGDAAGWTRRMADDQNSQNAGAVAALTPQSVVDLEVVAVYPTDGRVSATPIAVDGLLFVPRSTDGTIFVFDAETGKRLILLDTGAAGGFHGFAESTGTVAEVTVPDGNGGTREEKRFYVGVDDASKTLWCLDVDEIVANKGSLENDDGRAYVCDGASWPVGLSAGVAQVSNYDVATGGGNLDRMLYHGNPLFRKDQRIRVGGTPGLLGGAGDTFEIRDVIFTPTGGHDCHEGQFWALDAYSGEILWMFDPIKNADSLGGVSWYSPAITRDGSKLIFATGDCTMKPNAGELFDSTVALDPSTGEVIWYHQHKLIDAEDLDIGNSPTIVDVAGEDGCHVVVTPDKDGCIYAFPQEADVPGVGEAGFDPLRIGQQRRLWRQCLLQGSLGGGFLANGAAWNGRWIMASGQGMPFPGDSARAWALDACTGEGAVGVANLTGSQGEGAIASGMWFHPAGNPKTRLQVLRAEPPFDLLATVTLPTTAGRGGGGPSIAADGTIYVPLDGGTGGVAVVKVVPGSGSSVPEPAGPVSFAGARPAPQGLLMPAHTTTDRISQDLRQ